MNHKSISKSVSTLQKTKYLLISSIEDMFDHRDNCDKIISMMKRTNKKIHRFYKGRGIIIKVSNTPKKIKLVSDKKVISITIE